MALGFQRFIEKIWREEATCCCYWPGRPPLMHATAQWPRSAISPRMLYFCDSFSVYQVLTACPAAKWTHFAFALFYWLYRAYYGDIMHMAHLFSYISDIFKNMAATCWHFHFSRLFQGYSPPLFRAYIYYLYSMLYWGLKHFAASYVIFNFHTRA